MRNIQEEQFELEDISKCPFCGAKQLSEDKQPISGTHALTRLYECGLNLTVILSSKSVYLEGICTRKNDQ